MNGHLVDLVDGWGLWRWFALRAAGFAAADLAGLASPSLAAAADRLIALETSTQQVRQRTAQVLRSATRDVEGVEEKQLQKVLKRLKAGLPAPEGLPAALADVCAPLSRAEEEAAQQRELLAQLFERESPALRSELCRLAQRPLFREALLWQNRAALHGSIEGLLRTPVDKSDKETRKRERLTASYLQRYSAKNDTIGFFGPHAWGRVSDAPIAVEVRSGPITERHVCFEYWAIDRLAARLAEDPALLQDLIPRPAPAVRLEGTLLHHSAGRATELPEEFARVLAACDGRRTAREIANELAAEIGVEREEIHELLAELAAKQLLTLTLEVPSDPFAERALRALLERVVDDDARGRALGALDELEARRRDVAEAAGNPERLNEAIAALESTFHRLTGQESARRPGEVYAGRTPFVEDCLRDLDLHLGRRLADRLAAPLTLLAKSARWYTYEIARRYRHALDEVYEKLSAARGERAIDFIHFSPLADEHFSTDPYRASGITAGVSEELGRRWAEILAIPFDQPRVERRAADLAPRIDAAFAAPCAGWPIARHHSPDIAIAAADVGAIARGDYLVVLGELHTGKNTLWRYWVYMHPEREAMQRAQDQDVPTTCIVPVVPRERYFRTMDRTYSAKDFDLEVGRSRSWRPREQVLRVSDLIVEKIAGQLVVRTRDGRQHFDIIAFYEQHLGVQSAAHFSVIGSRPHTPRVTIDGVVVHREHWCFEPAQLQFAALDDPLQRFVAVRRWAQSNGLPRRLFYKVPEEAKPCYLDLDSPVFVELMCKLARGCAKLTLSEMLPSTDEVWLDGGVGSPVTCELRIVMRDPEPWRPA